jgi:hypothetical protein
MALRVRDIKHVLSSDADIDPNAVVDPKKLDGFVFACGNLAQAALSKSPPSGFTDFERDHLNAVIAGQAHSHRSIRCMVQGEENASAVDALAIARLQLETLYSFCFMLQDAENVRWFLKCAWKNRYIQFLLGREEWGRLPRFSEHLTVTALPLIDMFRRLSSVTDEEKRTIEVEEPGLAPAPGFTPAKIENFPTPAGVIQRVTSPSQRRMLKRLYPEYQCLCSFAHPGPEAAVIRTVCDPRSPHQGLFSSGERREFYQRQVVAPAVMGSTIAAVQVATEVAAIYPADIDLIAKVTEAWSFLVHVSLLARTVWEIRTKEIWPAVRSAPTP